MFGVNFNLSGRAQLMPSFCCAKPFKLELENAWCSRLVFMSPLFVKKGGCWLGDLEVCY